MRVLVCDWDETITTKDTTALIASVPKNCSPHQIPPFTHYSSIYADAYQRVMEEWSSEGEQRDSVEREIEFQQRMRPVEMSSVEAMERDRYFRGVHIDKFRGLAGEIRLQEHVMPFLQHLHEPFYILSVNWCRTLIEEVLARNGIDTDRVTVLANDLEVDAAGITTGHYDPRVSIRTGYDKLQQLNRIRKANPGRDVVYIGDSSGDVLPIVMADTGIVVAGGTGLVYLEQLVNVKPLAAARTLGQSVFVGTWRQLHDAWQRPCDERAPE